ncbi:hypothetical protein NECID01_1908 [Nematocida sp. AWRm77]|nr:hypothetical protein NECID01_1908 [Nematocida sp. AWRm77]
MEYNKDSVYNNQNIRKKIEMQYKSEKTEEPKESISSEIKNCLIAYHINSAASKRERKMAKTAIRECGFCHVKHTSLWRRIGDTLVCNACGLYYRIHGKIRDKAARRHPSQPNSSTAPHTETSTNGSSKR